MLKLTPITHLELIKRLRKYGFEGPFQGGKHQFMLKDDVRLTLPNPHKKEIGLDLLSKILKQANISRSDWSSHK